MQKLKIIDTSNRSIHNDWYKALKVINNYKNILISEGFYENKKN